MNTDAAIRIENLGKRYRYGGAAPVGDSLRQDIVDWSKGLFRRNHRRHQTLREVHEKHVDESPDYFWALKNVNLEIRPGEALGIIGRNGAGKSTLLKILSRITPPTTGKIGCVGRVASLLEVGTGFHRELTGRENVFLNGSILGMKRSEIARKFDEIVAFAEVEKFINTPVKFYSSGMYVRLAFSVAAHMEPDILVVDEVLSVGDLSFQRKCIDFMQSLHKRDVTILFVSHNMFTIKTMCERVAVLGEGQVQYDGPVEQGIELYEKNARLGVTSWASERFGSDPSKCAIYISDVELLDENGTQRSIFDFGQRMRVRVHYKTNSPIKNPNFCIGIIRSDNVGCTSYSSALDGLDISEVHGEGMIEVLTPPLKLISEVYRIDFNLWDASYHDLHCSQQGPTFHVRHELYDRHFGVFVEPAKWSWRPTT